MADGVVDAPDVGVDVDIAVDFGLDVCSAAARGVFRERIEEIVTRYDDVRQGAWNPTGGGRRDYLFHREGADVVITKPSGQFVTVRYRFSTRRSPADGPLGPAIVSPVVTLSADAFTRRRLSWQNFDTAA